MGPKAALITGASSGIGLAIAEMLGEEGYGLTVAARRPDKLEGAADGLREKGYDVQHIAGNLGDEDTIKAVVAQHEERFGRLDVLVNNAGVGGGSTPLHELDLDDWNRTLAVNLTGPFLCTRAAMPHLLASGRGRIINIASVLGLVPARLQSSYIAAKAGVVNLTKAMALELAPHGVLVNAVAPGSTQTQGWEKWIKDAGSEAQDLHARLMSHIPLGRPGTPQEMANAVLFLAAPESSYITGHVLTVDGGWTAGFSRDF